MAVRITSNYPGGFITVRLRWCVPKSCRNVVSVLRPLVPSRDKVCRVTALAKTSRRSKPKTLSPAKTEYIELRSEENELWRLDEAIRIIQSGGVGIIPTDSSPSFVCDLGNRSAVQRLYELKQINASKPLSILCRNLQDVSTYTMGFPASRVPGQPDLFKVAKRALPGPVEVSSGALWA